MPSTIFEKEYKRFATILLPYNLDYMAIDKELILDYINAILYYKYNGEIIPLTDNALEEHVFDYNNPHNITKDQIGLDKVLNVHSASIESFLKHKFDYNNPHKVTPRQIGLEFIGNVTQASDDDMKDLKALAKELEKNLKDLRFKQSQTEYTCIFKFTPTGIPMVVRVKYFDKWRYGYIQSLPNGKYEYEIYPRESTKKVIVRPPINSTVELIDGLTGEISMGRLHFLKPGQYIIKVSLPTYKTYVRHLVVEDNDGDTIIVNIDELVPDEYPVTIYTAPVDATVSIEYKGKIYNTKELNLPVGRYEVTVSAPGFVPKTESFTVTDSQLNYALVQLQRKKYKVKINVDPIDANVYVSHRDYIGEGTNHIINEDKYTVVCKRDGYYDARRSILVEDTDNLQVFNISLRRKSYSLNIKTIPDNATIEIYTPNMSLVSKNRKNLLLEYGYYIIKTKLFGYETNDLNIFMDKDKEVTIDLNVIKYNVEFRTSPPLATIELYDSNSNIVSQTEYSKQYLVTKGNYKYICRFKGFMTIEKNIFIDSNRIIEVDLKPSFAIRLISNPIGAEIKMMINDKYQSSNNDTFIVSKGTYLVYAKLPGYSVYNELISITKEGDYYLDLKEKPKSVVFRSRNPLINEFETLITAKQGIFKHIKGSKLFLLPKGKYNIKISSYGYKDILDTLEVLEDDILYEFDMVSEKRYDVTINTELEAKILVENISDTKRKMIGRKLKLLPGEYSAIITLKGYETLIHKFEVVNTDLILSLPLHKLDI